ncbi:hypothetical protein [Yoonia sp. 2307UL14-13]|uniref:hypothetical protein n=1 Tax=Yoonia sp. 2307UL14-13 TaxID=3126506 RepID=UPI0030AC18A6
MYGFRSQFSSNVQYDATNETITKPSRSGGTFQISLADDQSPVGTTGFKLYDGQVIEDLPGGGGFTRTYNFEGFRGETESGGGSVTFISAHPSFGGYQGMARHIETEMPTTGSATLSGDYFGYFSAIRDTKEFTYIYGATELDLNYTNATVQGRISERIDSAGNVFEDVILQETDVSAGRFTGDISGGAMIAEDFDVAHRHQYDGMIVGPEGNEAVGGIAIRHTNTEADEFGWESGAFVVD